MTKKVTKSDPQSLLDVFNRLDNIDSIKKVFKGKSSYYSRMQNPGKLELQELTKIAFHSGKSVCDLIKLITPFI